MSNEDVVVCDNGTGFVKAGFASEHFPRHMFPSMVGKPTLRAEEAAIGDIEIKDVMCGDEAAAVRQALEISYPIDCGIVRNWEDMESLWDYTFYEKMKIDPTEMKIMLTEAPLNPKKNREKTVEAMFEKYQFAGAHVSIQAMLTLYAQGLLTGVVVDSTKAKRPLDRGGRSAARPGQLFGRRPWQARPQPGAGHGAG